MALVISMIKQIEVIDQIIALDSESSFGKRAIRNKKSKTRDIGVEH